MKSVLIIGSVWPEPGSSAAGVRMLRLLELFALDGFRVLFCTAVAPSEFSADLSSMGVESFAISLNSESFDKMIGELQPDVVIFDRFTTEEQFGWRVAEFSPKTVRVLDTEDLHFLRRYRMRFGNNWNVSQMKQEEDTKRELLSILRCDLSLVLSEVEYELLVRDFGVSEDQLFFLAFPKPEFEVGSHYDDREGFCFIGNFHHKPNLDAVRYLKKEIWPAIRKLDSTVRLHIYGAYPTQEVMELHQSRDGFLVHGRAQNVREILGKHLVLLAPLRFGAGIKGKIVDAISVGTLVLSNRIGFEGFGADEDWEDFSYEGVEVFSRESIDMYSNEQKWRNGIDKQQILMKHYFDTTLDEGGFLKCINVLLEDIEKHRLQNYIISLLTSDTIWSKKYMSKWIAAKNNVSSS